jgi:hypothetical protein
MTQLSWRPVLPDPGGLADSPKLPPDVSCVEGTACPCAEDKILIAPLRSGDEPFPRLPLLMGLERIDRHLGKA